MSSITAYEKERILRTFRHWYQSHRNSFNHYQEAGNDKAAEYHQNQMNNLRWMANIINKLDIIEDYNLEIEDKEPF